MIDVRKSMKKTYTISSTEALTLEDIEHAVNNLANAQAPEIEEIFNIPRLHIGAQ